MHTAEIPPNTIEISISYPLFAVIIPEARTEVPETAVRSIVFTEPYSSPRRNLRAVTVIMAIIQGIDASKPTVIISPAAPPVKAKRHSKPLIPHIRGTVRGAAFPNNDAQDRIREIIPIIRPLKKPISLPLTSESSEMLFSSFNVLSVNFSIA